MYPKLEDNEIVFGYPHVQGMQKDVYFYSHTNKENGAEDSVSKFNAFEVRWDGSRLSPMLSLYILGGYDP